jgi:hypothetical protein
MIKIKLRFFVFKVYIVNFQHVNQYLVQIMEHVYQTGNKDLYAIVQEQVEKKRFF